MTVVTMPMSMVSGCTSVGSSTPSSSPCIKSLTYRIRNFWYSDICWRCSISIALYTNMHRKLTVVVAISSSYGTELLSL